MLLSFDIKILLVDINYKLATPPNNNARRKATGATTPLLVAEGTGLEPA